ncbi:tetratricopeptide repeat-containing hybrid sensor histidine kinase/response regulator [Chitinibacter tainanensis]|uniref:tetratricopeptide repeat-containing hybrid sensor histidine kinase/response regulator n=1 Tax=Chitinibacter tainanensis TaxID=230667 RepID=UPI000408EEEA|nr:ATP-binding protein [Chitinibacter tainanensis]
MTQDEFSRVMQRQAQFRLRNYDQALSLANELEALAGADLYQQLQAQYLQGEALEKVGEFAAAKQRLLAVERQLVRHYKQDPLLLDLYECLGKACYAIGELNLALEYWSKCLELALGQQSIVHYIKAYTGIGGVYLYFGLFEESLRHHLLALEFARELDDPVLLMMLNLWLGSDYNELGRHAEALTHLTEARNFYRRQADAGQVSEVLMHSGYSCLGLRDIPSALKFFNESIRLAESHHHGWPLAMANAGLAEVYLAQGQAERALQFAQQAHEFALQNASIHHELRACRVKSLVLEALGQHAEALTAYERHCELSVQLAIERNTTQLQSAVLRRINRSEIRLKLMRAEQQREILENEKIQRQAEFLAEKNALLAVNKAKSDFLALVSHEIRTPLSGVIGMLRLARGQKELSDTTREQLSIGLENAETLLTIINDILDISKIEAGKITLETIPFDLHQLINQVAALFAPKAAEKGVRFVVDLAHLPKQGCLGDPTRLRQILFNLVGNAIKFTEQGSVTIGAYRDGEQIKFSIADTGIGLDEQSLGRLFNKFEQADTSTTRKYGGTGLGLSICQALVGLMDGSIGVTSQLGEGTCFRVELPLEPVDLQATVRDPVQLSPLPCQLRILYAEDIATNQLIVGGLLEEMGQRMQVVNNGQEAVELLTRQRFDLVLMDGRMPVMDGLEATRVIRRGQYQSRAILDPQSYVVALTANAAAEEQQAGFAAGMNDYLLKPIDPVKLHAVLLQAVAYQQQRGVELLPMLEKAPTPSVATGTADADWLRELSRAGVAVDEALNRLNGNHERLRRWLQQLFSEHQSLIDTLPDYQSRKDAAGLIGPVHALRGVAGTLGVMAIYQAAGTLEQALGQFQRGQVAQWPVLTGLQQVWAQSKARLLPLLGEPVSGETTQRDDWPALPTQARAAGLELAQALASKSLRARQKLQALQLVLGEQAADYGVAQLKQSLEQLDYPAALRQLRRQLPEKMDEN